MPKRKHTGRCRLCGEIKRLTREHIPPGAAFNIGRTRQHTVEEFLWRDGEDLPGGELRQGGMWGYTLCKPCNDLTGARYGDEYRRWAIATINMLAGTNVRELDAEPKTRRGPFTFDGGPPPRPGAFVRQVLAMMCSVSSGFDLATRYPAIRRIVLDSAVEPLPAGMSLGMTVVLSTRSRIAAPMLVIDTKREAWRWIMEVAHAPLATLLVLASNDRAEPHLCDLSSYVQTSPDERMRVDGVIEVGFAHSYRLADYRTKAGIEYDAAPTIFAASVTQ